MLVVIEWFVWTLSCAIAIIAFIAFLKEVFIPEPFPLGPQAIYPIFVRRLMTALYTLGMVAAIVTTAVWHVSKLHLLWFVPLYHFFGTQWIGWIYLNWPFKFSATSVLAGICERYNREIAACGVIKLQKKTTVAAADSSLWYFPLLCLYFDNFGEIRGAWQQYRLDVARHDSDIRSCHLSLNEIMGDENLFLNLYKNKLLRLRLSDGTELRRDTEDNYLDRIVHPEKYADELSFGPDSDPQLDAMMKETRREIDTELKAIRLRYGVNSD